jgi:hypothetical protein
MSLDSFSETQAVNNARFKAHGLRRVGSIAKRASTCSYSLREMRRRQVEAGVFHTVELPKSQHLFHNASLLTIGYCDFQFDAALKRVVELD